MLPLHPSAHAMMAVSLMTMYSSNKVYRELIIINVVSTTAIVTAIAFVSVHNTFFR